jgi:hypothetical protein
MVDFVEVPTKERLADLPSKPGKSSSENVMEHMGSGLTENRPSFIVAHPNNGYRAITEEGSLQAHQMVIHQRGHRLLFGDETWT